MASITFRLLADIGQESRRLLMMLVPQAHIMHVNIDNERDMQGVADHLRKLADDPKRLREMIREGHFLYASVAQIDSIEFKV